MRKLFGTDGIRGTANQEPMTAETALKIGMAAGRQFLRGDHRHRVVIGKDTRLSGYLLEPALTAGFIAMGMDVILVGPLPTPAVAMLTRSLRADLGAMISASHNPYQDNGIKFFDPEGRKLSDEIEVAIEARIDNGGEKDLVASNRLGRAMRLDDALGRYMEHVKMTFPRGRMLNGLRIVVDCANGAAYRVAPTVLWELGAEVVPIGVSPDGFNINQNCGSTSSAAMCEAVVAHKAHLGIALDGDADRMVMADEHGERVDGDQILALVARSWQEMERLKGGGIVATVMSNLGLERYLQTLGLGLVRVQVGDRYVVEHMRKHGYNIGGEQSGHIVFGDFGTTGDGLIAALQVLSEIVRTGKPTSEVVRCFDPMPQLLRNVRFANSMPLENSDVLRAIQEGESTLGKNGRLLIRKSGTEPVIRIMAEGKDEAVVDRVVGNIVTAIERAVR
ncbi:MAG: phosphoglucosamine mutase [Pseudomonadota bacterium]